MHKISLMLSLICFGMSTGCLGYSPLSQTYDMPLTNLNVELHKVVTTVSVVLQKGFSEGDGLFLHRMAQDSGLHYDRT